MPEITVKLEIFCAKCGAALNDQTTERKRNRYITDELPTFEVEPCEKCLEEAKDEAFNSGKDEGYEEGKREKEEE